MSSSVLVREEFGFRYAVVQGGKLEEVQAAAAATGTIFGIPGAKEIDSERFFDLQLFFHFPVVAVGEDW